MERTRAEVAWRLMEVLSGIEPTDVAAQAGKYEGWRAPLDYMSLIKLNVKLGILDIESGKCSEAADTYLQLTCPSGYLKKPIEAVRDGCQSQGLSDYGDYHDCFEVFYDSALAAEDPDAAQALALERSQAAGYLLQDVSVLKETRKYECVCSPCSKIPDNPVIVQPTAIQRGRRLYSGADLAELIGADRTCSRLQQCLQANYGDVVTMTVRTLQSLKGTGPPRRLTSRYTKRGHRALHRTCACTCALRRCAIQRRWHLGL